MRRSSGSTSPWYSTTGSSKSVSEDDELSSSLPLLSPTKVTCTSLLRASRAAGANAVGRGLKLYVLDRRWPGVVLRPVKPVSAVSAVPKLAPVQRVTRELHVRGGGKFGAWTHASDVLATSWNVRSA